MTPTIHSNGDNLEPVVRKSKRLAITAGDLKCTKNDEQEDIEEQ